jgi:hypothetical protein
VHRLSAAARILVWTLKTAHSIAGIMCASTPQSHPQHQAGAAVLTSSSHFSTAPRALLVSIGTYMTAARSSGIHTTSS